MLITPLTPQPSPTLPFFIFFLFFSSSLLLFFFFFFPSFFLFFSFFFSSSLPPSLPPSLCYFPKSSNINRPILSSSSSISRYLGAYHLVPFRFVSFRFFPSFYKNVNRDILKISPCSGWVGWRWEMGGVRCEMGDGRWEIGRECCG